MELGKALEIVYKLAEEKIVDTFDEGFKDEARKQAEALDVVHDHIVNEFGED